MYFRYLNLRLKGLTHGLDVQVGRFGYISGAESPSGDPKIEAVKRQRLDSRVIGEFEWSLYQRGFDGVRIDLDLRIDVHRLDLAAAQDRWYSGSGATQKTGTTFGYAGRRSNGATSLGSILEGSADYSISRNWSLTGYIGMMRGGDVVRRTFAGDWLTFGYLENVVQF